MDYIYYGYIVMVQSLFDILVNGKSSEVQKGKGRLTHEQYSTNVHQ